MYFLGCLVLGVSIAVWNSSGRPEAGLTPSKEGMLEKEAVAKIFAGHRFTPPVPLAGPTGLTWYVGSRAFSAHSIEQIMVGVRRGANFTVEVSSFKRDREEDPWVTVAKGSQPGLANVERQIRDQLRKELALEEQSK